MVSSDTWLPAKRTNRGNNLTSRLVYMSSTYIFHHSSRSFNCGNNGDASTIALKAGSLYDGSGPSLSSRSSSRPDKCFSIKEDWRAQPYVVELEASKTTKVLLERREALESPAAQTFQLRYDIENISYVHRHPTHVQLLQDRHPPEYVENVVPRQIVHGVDVRNR